MKSEQTALISSLDKARLAIIALVWFLVLVAPLLPAYALTISTRTEAGEFPGIELIPLTFQSLAVSVHNQVAATQSWFHFRNDHVADLEITCEFALGATEFVEGFSYYNGNERIVGEVLEKAAAEAVYEELTQIQHRDPGLLEQIGERFRFHVYPVQPGETKPIDVRHLSWLQKEEGVIEYVVPKENLPVLPTPFSLVVDLTDDLPIVDVSVDGHDAFIKREGKHHVRVVIEGEEVSFDRDLRIRYRLAADDYEVRFMAHRNTTDEGSFMLVVTPKDEVVAADVIGRDIVFVIDISGSMEGEPLEQTKWALIHILDQLNPEDRFEIVSFDDNAYPLLGGLQQATPRWRQDGQAVVGNLHSQGGTNILNAMKKALDILTAEALPERPRAIIFLTDGQGMNPASMIISEVRKRDSNVRVYSFGVGNGVNRPFLERIARDNRGIATLVSHPDHLEREMRRLYDRISMPLMVDLDIRFEGLDVDAVYPSRLPDLYRDGEVVVLGRYRRGGKGRVVVSGRLAGEEKVIDVDVVLPDTEERFAYVEKLWARKRIDQLMDTIADRGDAEELVTEVTRLGIIYNLVTEYTTFLAVPESLKTDEIKEMIRKGQKGYDKKLIDSVEGIKLSMQHIPPGDPVLTVDAPADAVKVTAYFPFGLVKRLQWDDVRGQWNVRFLVPRDVADGLYEIRVLIVHVDGHMEWRTIEYYIDGTAPEFEASIPATAVAGETIDISVDPYETVAEVLVVGPGFENGLALTLDLDSGLYVGKVTLPVRFPEGPVVLRVVVRDKARNRFEQDFEIWPEEEFEEDLEEVDDVVGC